jgi:hypothetical protein
VWRIFWATVTLRSTATVVDRAEWLEDLYVLNKLRKMRLLGANDTHVMRVAGLHRKRVDHGNRDFELDVVVMRSYQLFVFSCIVSNDATSVQTIT